MKLVAEFTIPGLPDLPNKNMYRHWTKIWKGAAKWKSLVAFECKKAKIYDMNLPKAQLTFTRHSSREPDGDNLQMSFKACRDALVESKVILDDKPSVIGKPDYLWLPRPTSKGGQITIKIEVAE